LKKHWILLNIELEIIHDRANYSKFEAKNSKFFPNRAKTENFP
jgi:hypothetical protein